MTYVLHYAPDNASLIVRLALEYRGLAYRDVLVDRAALGQRAPAYLALNPNGLIPVLETPQGPLFETGAILLWLGDTHGGLGPVQGDAARGDYLKWLFYVSNTLHPALRMLFYPDKYIGPHAGHQAALRSGLRQQIISAFQQLERIAQTKPAWLGSAQFTCLDFYIAACLRWSALYPSSEPREWLDLAALPALLDMCRKIEAHDCVSALQTAEGLGPMPFSAPSYPTPPHGSAT